MEILFILLVLITVLYFAFATKKITTVVSVLAVWMLIQTMLVTAGFYENSTAIPPRFMMLVIPPLIVILYILFSKRGNEFIHHADPKQLTYLHFVRFFVELFLYQLFLQKLIPSSMTFEGRNFDILSGLTAPVVAYLYFTKKKISVNAFIAWNLFALGLLFNVVITGIFSAPGPFQKFAFDQPNIAILKFPYLFLPSVIVVLVLFSHLILLKQAFAEKRRLAQRSRAV
jgi:hypothetical protein